MIKRIIGTLGTLAIVAAIVFAILGRKEYSSAIIFGGERPSAVVEGANEAEEQPVEVADSTVVEALPAQ